MNSKEFDIVQRYTSAQFGLVYTGRQLGFSDSDLINHLQDYLSKHPAKTK